MMTNKDKKREVINKQSREIIARVIEFMKADAESVRTTGFPLVPVKHVKERVLQATGISRYMYYSITRGTSEDNSDTSDTAKPEEDPLNIPLPVEYEPSYDMPTPPIKQELIEVEEHNPDNENNINTNEQIQGLDYVKNFKIKEEVSIKVEEDPDKTDEYY